MERNFYVPFLERLPIFDFDFFFFLSKNFFLFLQLSQIWSFFFVRNDDGWKFYATKRNFPSHEWDVRDN